MRLVASTNRLRDEDVKGHSAVESFHDTALQVRGIGAGRTGRISGRYGRQNQKGVTRSLFRTPSVRPASSTSRSPTPGDGHCSPLHARDIGTHPRRTATMTPSSHCRMHRRHTGTSEGIARARDR